MKREAQMKPTSDIVAESKGNALQGGLAFVTLVSAVSAMGGFLFGYETVVIAATIPLVKTQFGFSALMEGWFVSCGLVGCVAGVLLASRLSDGIGRRGVTILSGVMLALAALACAGAPDTTWLLSARFMGGVGVGIASIVSPLYISEVAPPQYRGRLVSLFQVTITVGIVAAMVINAMLQHHAVAAGHEAGTGLVQALFVSQSWRGMFLLQFVPAALFFLAALIVPESPRWLVLRSRLEQAREVLRSLRADDAEAEKELGEIQRSIAGERATRHEWRSAGLRRALYIGVFLTVFSELSGITVVMYYGPTILERTGASMSASLNGHAIIGFVLAAFTLLAIPLIDRIGRRRLLLVGVAGACLALLLTGIGFASGLEDGATIVALLCAFVAFFAFSIGPIKWVVISEIFPTNLRARAMGVATVALWLTDIVINQLFPLVRNELGIWTMFFACALFLAIQFIVVAIALPETKGMTLEQIAALWR
jgi:MFS transporter, SP family, arabinose:H+ symporter